MPPRRSPCACPAKATRSPPPSARDRPRPSAFRPARRRRTPPAPLPFLLKPRVQHLGHQAPRSQRSILGGHTDRPSTAGNRPRTAYRPRSCPRQTRCPAAAAVTPGTQAAPPRTRRPPAPAGRRAGQREPVAQRPHHAHLVPRPHGVHRLRAAAHGLVEDGKASAVRLEDAERPPQNGAVQAGHAKMNELTGFDLRGNGRRRQRENPVGSLSFPVRDHLRLLMVHIARLYDVCRLHHKPKKRPVRQEGVEKPEEASRAGSTKQGQRPTTNDQHVRVEPPPLPRLRAAHRVAAVVAAVAGAVAHGDRAAHVAGRRVFHEVLELLVDPRLRPAASASAAATGDRPPASPRRAGSRAMQPARRRPSPCPSGNVRSSQRKM